VNAVLRWVLPAAIAAGALALPGAAMANWTGTYTASFTNEVNENESNRSCYGATGNQTVVVGQWNGGWTIGQIQSTLGTASATPTIPSGATLVGGTVSVPAEIVSGAQMTPSLIIGGAPPPPWPTGASNCGNDVTSPWSVIGGTFSGTGVWQTLSGDGYSLFQNNLYNGPHIGAVLTGPDSDFDSSSPGGCRGECARGGVRAVNLPVPGGEGARGGWVSAGDRR
jgi:hypothetical protein